MKFKGKLPEASKIKELRPSLNTQKTSVALKVFNYFSVADMDLFRCVRWNFRHRSCLLTFALPIYLMNIVLRLFLCFNFFMFFEKSSILNLRFRLNPSLHSLFSI